MSRFTGEGTHKFYVDVVDVSSDWTCSYTAISSMPSQVLNCARQHGDCLDVQITMLLQFQFVKISIPECSLNFVQQDTISRLGVGKRSRNTKLLLLLYD